MRRPARVAIGGRIHGPRPSVRRADSEIRLAARALRECWPVPADRREGLVKVPVDVAEDPRAEGRDRAIPSSRCCRPAG